MKRLALVAVAVAVAVAATASLGMTPPPEPASNPGSGVSDAAHLVVRAAPKPKKPAASRSLVRKAPGITGYATDILDGSPRQSQKWARLYIERKYGWGADEFSCLRSLWMKESGWTIDSYDPAQGDATVADGSVPRTYGIPQANPADKMSSAGADWRTNPVTQMRWGASYVRSRYGSPCGAWSFWQDRAASGAYGFY